MNSSPIQRVQVPESAASRRRRILLLTVRCCISIVIVCCLWLIYPSAKIRINLSLIARSYTPGYDPATGEIVRFDLRQRGTQNISREEEFANQPLKALLELLPSDDSVRVFVVAQAIETQFRRGRFATGLAGLRAERESVTLDAGALDQILDVIDDDDIPRAAKEPFRMIVMQIEGQPIDSLLSYKETLLKATERSNPDLRSFGAIVLTLMKLESDEARAFVRRLSNDPDDRVRRSLFAQLSSALRREFDSQIPDDYRQYLFDLVQNGSVGLRLDALSYLQYIDLDHPDTFPIFMSVLSHSDLEARRRTIRALLEAIEREQIATSLDKYATAIADVIPSILPNGDADLMFKFLMAPNLAPDLQWNVIEQRLMNAEVSHRTANLVSAPDLWADLRDALFMPLAREVYRTSTADWPAIRDKFRPMALMSRDKLLMWAVEAIESDQDGIVMSGARLLMAIAPDEPDRLTPLLSHQSVPVRTMVMRVIHPSAEQIPLLLELLDNVDVDIRYCAVTALGQYDRSFTAEQSERMRKAFQSEQHEYPLQQWGRLLEKLPDGAAEMDRLITDSLQKQSVLAQLRAVHFITERGEITKWLPQLLELMRSEHVAIDAVVLVIDAGQPIESQEVAAAMLRKLSIDNTPVLDGRWGTIDRLPYAKRLLALCPQEAITSIVLSATVDRLTATQVLIDATTGKRLGELPIDRQVFALGISEFLGDDRPEVRQGAAQIIAAIGPAANVARERLIRLVTDPDYRVRISAATALGSFGEGAGAESAAALANMAKNDKQPGVQAAAIEALGQIGRHSEPWLATIDELSKKSDRMVRDTATRVLRTLKTEK